MKMAAASMVTLNLAAAEAMREAGASACTDITGFGLIGHALEVAKASGISIRLDYRNLPILAGTLEYSRAGFCAGGLNSNRDFYRSQVKIADSVPTDVENILFDHQTSVGLRLFSPPQEAESLLRTLRAEGFDAAEVGLTAQAASDLLTVA
jgi:selenide,water dikinase